MSLRMVADVIQATLNAGVCEWVICPGARNVALMSQISAIQELKLWTHFDERAAGFFALGRTMDRCQPVAVLCTSGTAVAELLPAVIEAHYQGRPLLIVSADREPSWRGSGAPQAIVQPGIFGQYAPPTIDLTQDSVDVVSCLKNWDRQGPLHLNVCLPEPKLDDKPLGYKLPEEFASNEIFRPKRRVNVAVVAQFLRNECWNGGVVLVGGLDMDEEDAALWLVRHLGLPVKAEATSQLRGKLGVYEIFDIDYLFKTETPGAVIRLGDVPVDRCWRDLENHPEIPVLSITRTGYSGLNRSSTVIHATVEEVLRALGEVDYIGDRADVGVLARKRTAILEEALRCFPESEQALIYQISLQAAMAGVVYLGNSMPIRQWNLFAQHEIEQVAFANRGANGIDGQMATFLGCAAEAETAWAVFGDLTAMYDANAPAMAKQLPSGIRVAAVINNAGGRIFERLPGGLSMDARLESLLIQPHGWSMKGLAEQWNCHYLRVTSADDLDREYLPGLTILEVVPDQEQTRKLWEMIAK